MSKSTNTIGFDACIRQALSKASVKFLTANHALTLRTINGLRDAAYHHLLEVSEEQLYIETQAGVTLFGDLLEAIFGTKLRSVLPNRVLPVSTRPPTDVPIMLAEETETIRQLLLPGARKRVQARARARALALMEKAVADEQGQPSDYELDRVLDRIKRGDRAETIFPGVAMLSLSTDGHGITFNMRITKKEGPPIHVVSESADDGAPLAIRRVDELGFYTLGRDDVAKKLGLSGPKTTALIRTFGLQNHLDYAKEFVFGKTRHLRYSATTVERLRDEMSRLDIDDVWRTYRAGEATRAAQP